MKILILGGTIFLGRALVDAALARGHAVTLFNRGQHNADLYPEVEKLRGNRDPSTGSGQALEALKGRRWDAVIDTSGYFPRIVQASAELLADAVEHYTFISSISVFADFKARGIAEGYPVGKIADETFEQITGESYGPLKALCEQTVERIMPGRVLNIRPGLIVGPHDPTDRFTYWPHRIAQGGEVVVPGRPDRPVQIIDVRDLAEWNVRMVEAKQTGVYNATGPDYMLTMYSIVNESRKTSGSNTRFVWLPETFLLEQGAVPWTEVTLWMPTQEDNQGFSTVNVGKAIAAGLNFRPLAETVRDTLAWDATRPADVERRGGIKPEREQQWLTAWRARKA